MRLIDSDAIGATLPYPVVDGYIGTADRRPAAGPAASQPIALPEISDGPHFWYAVQWFMFTGIGVAGIVVFIRGDLRDRDGPARPRPPEPARRRTAQRPTGPAGPEPPPSHPGRPPP